MTDVQALVSEARNSLGLDNPEKSQALFEELLGVESFDADSGIEIARACLDYAQALTPVSFQGIDPSEIPDEASRYLQHAEKTLQVITTQDARLYRAWGLKGIVDSINFRSEEALADFDKALALAPGNPALQYNQAYCLCELGRLDEASQVLADLVKAVPEDGMAWHLSGQVHQLLGEHEASLEAYQNAVTRLPQPVKSYMGLHMAYEALGRTGDALKVLQEAVHQFPDSRELCAQLGLFALSLGEWRTGWRYYHCRASVKQSRQPIPEGGLFPWKQGVPVRVRYDQGLGDELFFLRFLPVLRARGMTVSYATQPKLFPLLADNPVFADLAAVAPDQQWNWDATVGDLPYIAGMFSDSEVPPPLPLQVQGALQQSLKEELSRFGSGPYLGVVWQGGKPRAAAQKGVWKTLHKEIPPALLGEALHSWPGQVVVFQHLPTESDKREFETALGRRYLDWTALNHDLPQLLAALSLMDEYVGVSNTNMHLLASIGKTARVLVPQPADWRWMAEGRTSPWFPGFEIYRQDISTNWDAALCQLKNDLERKWK